MFQRKRIFRRITLILIPILLPVTALYAQEGRVSLDSKTITVGNVLESIESQSDYRFTYNRNSIDTGKTLNMPAAGLSIKEAMQHITKITGIRYVVRGNYIALVPAAAAPATDAVVAMIVQKADPAADTEPETELVPVPQIATVSILFPFDSDVIDRDFMDNARGFEFLDIILSDREFVAQVDSIMIMAASSPEGRPDYNRNLSLRRAEALKAEILARHPHITGEMVSAKADPRYWEGLIELVEEDADVPGRDALLDMLANPTMTDDAKSWRMKQMNGGATFAYLNDSRILHRLRAGSTTIGFYTLAAIPKPAPEPEPVVEPEPPVIEPEEPVMEPEPVIEPEPAPEPVMIVEEYTRPGFALKTNLLLDLVGGANLGVEIPWGDRFSVAANFAYAYSRLNNLYALQTIHGGIEGRYWFGVRDAVLTGWNVGVQATRGGRYDIQWLGGWQGDSYWAFSLTGGYSFSISRTFNIDLSLGAGFFTTPEARRYTRPQQGHLIWEKTHYNMTRFMLTRAQIDLVWRLGTNKKR